MGFGKRIAQLARGLMRLSCLWRQGGHCLGTDYPVEPISPLEVVRAVTRKDRAGEPGDGWFPDQKLSMEEALRLYTLDAAYAEFMEDRKGMLKRYLGDAVIFHEDCYLPHDRSCQRKWTIRSWVEKSSTVAATQIRRMPMQSGSASGPVCGWRPRSCGRSSRRVDAGGLPIASMSANSSGRRQIDDSPPSTPGCGREGRR
jgi:hypothetical protein